MSNLPYKLWLFLPLIFTHSIFGVYVAPESPNEGAGQVQITLPSGLDRIEIIDAPRDENGNVVGTFLDTIANQSTSTGNTFHFTANSNDFYGNVYIDWNATDATGTTSHTRANNGDYVTFYVQPTDDYPVLKTGVTNANNPNPSASYSVSEGNSFVVLATATDVDGGNPSIIVSGGADQAYFTFSSGQLNFNSAPDYEFPQDNGGDNIYNVELTAQDPTNSPAYDVVQAIQVTVTDSNDAPVINNGNVDLVFTIDEEEDSITWEDAIGSSFALSVTDVDSTSFTWVPSSQPKNGTLTLSPSNNTCTVDYEPNIDFWGTDIGSSPVAGTNGVADKFVVRVSDGSSTDEITFRVKVEPINDDAPVITTASSINHAENDTSAITLSATDPDESPSLSWSIISGDDMNKFNLSTGGNLTFVSQQYNDFEANNSYNSNNEFTFTAEVTDQNGQSDSTVFTIIVVDENEAPVIQQPNPLVVTMFEDNSSSFNPYLNAVDPDIYSANIAWNTLNWSLVSSPSNGQAVISGSGTTPTTFTYTPNANYNGTDSFSVRVADSQFEDNITIELTIQESDDLPVFSSSLYDGNSSVVLQRSENSTGEIFQVLASDPDGGTITYRINHGVDQSRFDINASTGWVSFATGFSPDFENPVDVNSLNTYEVTIAADDENGTSYQSFTIQVTDEYEAAYFVSDNNFSAPENQLLVGTVSVNDIDANDIHSFSIYPQSDDGGKFQIDQGTGELRFISSPDFENNGSISGNNEYNLMVRATDLGGVTADQNITVFVLDDNDQPNLSGGNLNPSSISIPEDTIVGSVFIDLNVSDQDASHTHIWSLSGDDASYFEIDPSTGELALRVPLDYENRLDTNTDNTYDLTLTATDSHSSSMTSEPFVFQVTIGDVNEPPFLIGDYDLSISMQEDNASSFVSPSWQAIDPETNSSLGISWSIMNNSGAKVTEINTNETNSTVRINSVDGTLTFLPTSNTNRYVQQSDSFQVYYEDSGGLDDYVTVQVSIEPVNDLPEINGTFLNTINHPEGTILVSDYNASDYNDFDSNFFDIHYTEEQYLTWEVDGPEEGLFTISQQGALRFISSPVFDGANSLNNRYDIIIKVSDEFGGVSSYPLAINVTNSQEPPALLTTLSTVEISEDESPISWESEWAGVDVQDPDGGTLTWSILQNGIYGVAEVEVNTGEIDYIPDPNQFGDDNFTVNVNDGDFDMNFTVYVRINQVNDPPQITDADPSGFIGQEVIWPENSPASDIIKSFSASDSLDNQSSDYSSSNFTWSLTGDDSNQFQLDINGNLTFRRSMDYENPTDLNSDNLYEIIIRATDNSVDYTEYPLLIRVSNQNDPPVFTSLEGASESSLSLNENESFVYNAVAIPVDENAAEINYFKGGGIDDDLFTVNESTGEINFQTPPNFEDPDDNDSDGIYLLEINATDGLSTATQKINIVILDVNEPPSFSSNSGNIQHDESDPNLAISTSTYVDDPDSSPQYSYSLDPTLSPDNQYFIINASTGIIGFDSSYIPDFENKLDDNGDNIYEIVVTVEDGTTLLNGNLSLEIQDLNDPPQIVGSDLNQITVEENTVFVRSLVASDQDNQISYPDVLIVVDDESIGWVENQTSQELSFSAQHEIEGSLSGASFSMSADFDRDGDTDAVLLLKNEGKVVLFENNGTGGFDSDELYVTSGSDPSYGVVSDFNEDGYPDFAVAMEGLDKITIFQNNAVSSIGFSQIHIEGLGAVNMMDSGDIDSDGDLDLVSISQNSITQNYQIKWFGNDGLWFDNPNQPLSFTAGSELSFDILEINRPKFLSLGDVDQDGDTDLTVASSQDGNFNLFLNDGNGSFAGPELLYNEGSGEAHVVKLADLNNDGNLDLVMSTKSPSKLGVMLQSANGGGQFQSPTFFFNSSFFVNAFDFGDLDLDGDLDIVGATFADSTLRSFLNDGNGRFSESNQNVLLGQESIVSLSINDFSQTNSILEFSIKENYKDWERFVFRPRYSGNLFFKENPDFENTNDVGRDHQFEIKVVATDDENDPNAGTERLVVINVDNVYEAPVITEPNAGDAIQLTIPEHTTFIIDVNSTNDEELDLGETTTYSISGGVDAGLFQIDEFSGELSFIEGPDYEANSSASNSNTFHVVIRAQDDGPGQSFSDRVVRVYVADDNDLPIFDPLPSVLLQSVPEDANLTLSLSDLNASDPEGAVLSWSKVAEPTNGSATFDQNFDSLLYVPNPDFYGTDQITLQIEDNASLSAQISIEFIIEPLNDAPVITTSALIQSPENQLSVSTLTADDVDQDVLIWSLIGGTDIDRFQLTNSGILNFIGGAPDYENPDSNDSDLNYEINVEVTDGNATVPYAFTIQIEDVPDIPPVVSNLESTSATNFTVPEGQNIVVDLNVSDVEDNNLTLSITGGDDQSLFGLSQSGTLTFLSNPDYENPDDLNGDNFYILDINVTDGMNPIQRSLIVEVLNANEEAPQFDQNLGASDSPVLHPENQSFVTTLVVSDDTNETLEFLLIGGTDQSKFELNSTSGELHFKPDHLPDFEVNGSFDGDNIYDIKIQVSDGIYSSTGEMFIEISDLNEPPTLSQSTFEVIEDQATELMVAVFDPENDPFSWDFLRSPNNGILSLIDGGYLYTPNQDFNGFDEVQFIAIDDQNISYELNASINVLPQNDDPSAVDDELDFYRDGSMSLTIDVLSNDSSTPDENESLEITDYTNKNDSNLTFNASNQSFTYTPPEDYIGPYTFTYTLYDGARYDKAQVTINVANRVRDEINNDPWKYVANFGYFTENKYPWILHSQIGWIYLSQPGGENSVSWMWNDEIGWFWTGRDYFPYFFVEDTQKWYTWEGGIYDPNGVAIFDFATDNYITLHDFQKQRINAVLDTLKTIQDLIEFVGVSEFFTTEERSAIYSELFISGQSPTLQNLLK